MGWNLIGTIEKSLARGKKRPTSPRLKISDMMPSESAPSFSSATGPAGLWSPRSPRAGFRSPRSFRSTYHVGSPGQLAQKYAQANSHSVEMVNWLRNRILVDGETKEHVAQPNIRKKGASPRSQNPRPVSGRLIQQSVDLGNTYMYRNAAQSPTSLAARTRGIVIQPIRGK